jgi:hypothetical protein
MTSLRLVAVLSALAIAWPAAAQLRPSPLGDIYESYNDCFKVATKYGLKPENLPSLGWSRATISSKRGEAIADEPIIFGHSKRQPLIMLSAETGEGVCIVMARLEKTSAFEEFKKAWGGKLPEPDSDGAISFLADGHIVQLRQTGSRQEPALSIAVMTSTGSK